MEVSRDWYLVDTWSPEGTSTSLGFMAETSTRITISAPHRELLEQVLDKWSVHILEELCDRPCRFNQLKRLIPVSQKSLTATLRRLERNGIVQRRVTDTRPVAVEYSITPLGKTLREPIDAILRWSDSHLPAIEQARNHYDEMLAATAEHL